MLKLGEVVVAGLNKTVLSSLASRTHRPVWPQVVVSAVLLATPLVVGGEWLLARTERHRRKHEGELTFETLCTTRWDRMDAYWWAFATITTIGYGDLDTACLGDVYTTMTCYVLGSVVLVAAAIANLTAALKKRGEDLEERRLLEAFDVDEIMALDLDGDGVSKAEFLLGMLSAMDAVDAAKLELYASHFDELDVDRAGRLTAKELGRARPRGVAVEPPPLDEEAKDAGPVRPTVSFDASVDEQAAARAAALRAKKKQERRRRRRRRRDRAAAAASDDDEATSFCPWWLRCDCTAADVVDDAGDVEGGGVEARDVDASVSARDVEPDACRVC